MHLSPLSGFLQAQLQSPGPRQVEAARHPSAQHTRGTPIHGRGLVSRFRAAFTVLALTSDVVLPAHWLHGPCLQSLCWNRRRDWLAVAKQNGSWGPSRGCSPQQAGASPGERLAGGSGLAGQSQHPTDLPLPAPYSELGAQCGRGWFSDRFQ